jgi:hypothetical protein
MGLTVYLRVYPQACPLGVCNPQLDTRMAIPTSSVYLTTLRSIQAIESGGLVMAW